MIDKEGKRTEECGRREVFMNGNVAEQVFYAASGLTGY